MPDVAVFILDRRWSCHAAKIVRASERPSHKSPYNSHIFVVQSLNELAVRSTNFSNTIHISSTCYFITMSATHGLVRSQLEQAQTGLSDFSSL